MGAVRGRTVTMQVRVSAWTAAAIQEVCDLMSEKLPEGDDTWMSRNRIAKEALRRGLLAMAAEHGVKLRGDGAP